MLQTEVVIVGGSLNGLTTALLLAHQGVRCTVIERHPGTSIQYKFAGISPRSMEIFRGVGIEAEIRAHRTGDQQGGGIARGKNLADPEIGWMREAAWPDVGDISPCDPATCDQHVLEPILRRHAERLGARMLFGTEMLSFEQDERSVRARVRHRDSGREEGLQAQYMIAADGANGAIRSELGIERHGAGVLQHWMNIIFATDLAATIHGKRFTSCFVTDLNATVTTREGGRWLLALQYDADRGEKPEDFDAERCRALVRKAAGRSDVRADLVDARPWQVAAYVADRFRAGRIFLAGDAAHVMPPTGAFGGNTGIHDAHNLAWKLAAVLRGEAETRLLDTYDAERRPVAEHSLAQALARLQRWFKDPSKHLPPTVPMVDDYDVVFGQRYAAGALLGAESSAAAAPFAKARELAAQPGTRAPHMDVEAAGSRFPVFDLFGASFVLLAGPRAAEWRDSARRVAQDVSLPLTGYRVAEDGDIRCAAREWSAKYGACDTGAVLVRPDGFVAWRVDASTDAPDQTLRDVLVQLGLRR